MRNLILTSLLFTTLACSASIPSAPDAAVSCVHLPLPPDRPVMNPVRIAADGVVITSDDFVVVQNYINGTHKWMDGAVEQLDATSCGIDRTLQQP